MNLSLRPYLCTHSDEKPNDGWIPWAYYSVTCGDTYKTQDAPYIELSRTPGVKVREDRALCTSQYSEMDPLTDGDVPFATLEGRPSVMNFEHDTELQACSLTQFSVPHFHNFCCHKSKALHKQDRDDKVIRCKGIEQSFF